LLTAVVTGVSLVAAALVSRVAVQREFTRLESLDRGRSLEGAAALLSERIERVGPAAVNDSMLGHLATWLEQELILASPAGRVIATSAPELRSARIDLTSEGRVTISSRVRRGRELQTRRAVIRGQPKIEVRERDGRVLGTLYPFPRAATMSGSRRSFLPTVNRWLLVAVGGASGLAILLTLALSRRVLGPIEALTGAVRRLAAGDMSQRVAVRSGDEIGELATSFNAMAEALERNESLRRSLVSDVAHELRTPLTNLRCQIESIQDGLLAADPATVRSLHEETLLLARLVDDLQELALAEAGQLPLHRAAVPVGPAVEAALAAVGARAAERGIAVRAEVAGDAPEADADPGRLAQILRNLLANAITHTTEGGTVVVSAAAADGAVRIAVQDDGPGIAPDHLPHVFDRFYRADPSRARATGGAGLGLAIVKQLVEAHGGVIAVESAPGAGARFTFTLPARPS
jgi:signal transduction histidine kinase